MKARVIALYLPQFHPIPENNRWWGPGFTEWTNVAKAKPLFKGHVQPKIPADLGFYDLRLPEVRQQQADLAHEAGIEGFCYYHYWFGGKQLLERPFNEVLASGKPDFPFCLCWANHSWSNKTWNRKSNMQSNSMLIEQTYPGYDDDYNHFMNVLPAFRDKRYITIDGKPVFFLYNPWEHTRVKEWIVTWRKLAQVNCIGMRRGEMLSEGRMLNLCKTILRKAGLPIGQFFDYSRTVKGFFPPETKWENVYPTIVPQWDRSPRAATLDGIYVHATPKAFEEHINDALTYIEKKDPEHRVMILKSWNEWGEGNYVEPDLEFGHGWLEAIKNTIQ